MVKWILLLLLCSLICGTATESVEEEPLLDRIEMQSNHQINLATEKDNSVVAPSDPVVVPPSVTTSAAPVIQPNNNSIIQVESSSTTASTPVIYKTAPEEMEHEKKTEGRFNYASLDAGAVILSHNPQAKNVKNLLQSDKDKYALTPSEERLWFVLGLSEDILVDSVIISNYELYASSPKKVQILGSQTYPVSEWAELGNFTMKAERNEQVYSLKNSAWVRYLKIRVLEHYGNEFFCTMSGIRVLGSTMLESLQKDMEVVKTTLTDETEELAFVTQVPVIKENSDINIKENLIRESVIKESAESNPNIKLPLDPLPATVRVYDSVTDNKTLASETNKPIVEDKDNLLIPNKEKLNDMKDDKKDIISTDKQPIEAVQDLLSLEITKAEEEAKIVEVKNNNPSSEGKVVEINGEKVEIEKKINVTLTPEPQVSLRPPARNGNVSAPLSSDFIKLKPVVVEKNEIQNDTNYVPLETIPPPKIEKKDSNVTNENIVDEKVISTFPEVRLFEASNASILSENVTLDVNVTNDGEIIVDDKTFFLSNSTNGQDLISSVIMNSTTTNISITTNNNEQTAQNLHEGKFILDPPPVLKTVPPSTTSSSTGLAENVFTVLTKRISTLEIDIIAFSKWLNEATTKYLEAINIANDKLNKINDKVNSLEEVDKKNALCNEKANELEIVNLNNRITSLEGQLNDLITLLRHNNENNNNNNNKKNDNMIVDLSDLIDFDNDRGRKGMINRSKSHPPPKKERE